MHLINNTILKIIIPCLFLAALPLPASAELLMQKVMFQKEPASTGQPTEIIEFYTDNPATPRIFTLPEPARVVIDLPVFRWRVPAAQLQSYSGTLLRQVRYARHSDTVSRIVLDINGTVTPQLLSQPNSTTHRIRLVPEGAPLAAVPVAKTTPTPINRSRDVSEVRTKEGTLGRIVDSDDEEKTNQPTDNEAKHSSASPYPAPRLKPGSNAGTSAQAAAKRIIVIDAGHGGQDPGASGPGGTKEKYITLAYAEALKAKLESTGRYKAVLTRDKDFFIPLRQRVNIARQKSGNMFISLHADSAPGAQARGLSVYSLSETASDGEAAKLATKENKADIINGIDLSGASKDVTDILIDLAQRNTMIKSESLGASLLSGIQQANVRTLSKPHRHAGFAVLKAPDIPSALIELGFLSHPEEEKLLQSVSHRSQIIEGLVKGIDSYFAKTTTNR